jgi:hypothetical protein
MEYKSSQVSGQSWYFTDLDDSRLNIVPPNRNNTIIDMNNPNRIITGGSGAVTDNGDKVTLFEIFTNSAYNETKISQDHIKYKAQNAIMEPTTDWTNFEVTFYAEFMAVNANSEIAIYGRSGRHVKGRACEGTYYRVAIKSNGNVRCESKHWHPGGTYPLESNAGSLGDLEMMRIGIKFIVFTNTDGKTVTLKLLVDMAGNNIWSEMCYVLDDGSISNNSFLRCGDDTTKVITWGGPIIGVEVRNFPSSGFAIDKWSVREIDALAPKVTIPTPAVPFDPEAVSPPTAPPSTGYRTDLDDDDWDDDLDYPIPPWGEPGDNAP